MLKSAKDVLSSGDIRSVVDFAIEANRSIQSAGVELGKVKVFLRKLADGARMSDPTLTNVRFEGLLGSAQVVLVTKPLYKARKGMKPVDLKRVLPAEVYASLFTERVIVDVSEEYEGAFADLSPGVRRVVESYIEAVPQTSRVNLPE